ncbi:hydrogenase expression/formation protein HypE [Thermocrinis sp.]
MSRIKLSHGGGGEDSWKLIKEVFLKHFSNTYLNKLEDSTVLDIGSKIAFTTDAFTVKPIHFKGGNIGKLAVAGTVNDLAVMGAKPLYISASFIIEEGFLLDELELIVKSMKEEADKTGVLLVAGDTKVVPRGSADGIFISTSGIGLLLFEGLSASNVKPGDVLIITGSIGDHGACILAEREGFEIDIESDCNSLWNLVEAILSTGAEVHAMRDPTRGGLSAVLHEWAQSSKVSFIIEEEHIPVKEPVLGLCELLGLEPYHLASEGRIIIAVKEEDANKVLDVLKEQGLEDFSVIGIAVPPEKKSEVLLKTPYGTYRYLEPPAGELLPRIC